MEPTAKTATPGPDASGPTAPQVVFRPQKPVEEPSKPVAADPIASPLVAIAVPQPPAALQPDPTPPVGNDAKVEQPPPLLSPFDLAPVAGLQRVDATEPPRTDAAVVAPLPAGAMLVEETPPADPVPASSENPPTEAILRDIQREAEQKGAQQEELERLKPQAQALLAAEAVARVQEERAPFREELRQLVKDMGTNAGPEINRICDQYGRESPPGAQETYRRLLRVSSPRMTRQATVDLMRACGIPEPLILDHLAHQFHKLLNTRGGPRDTHEVRVFAARALLAIPLPPTRKPATRPTAGQPAASVPAVSQPSPVARP